LSIKVLYLSDVAECMRDWLQSVLYNYRAVPSLYAYTLFITRILKNNRLESRLSHEIYTRPRTSPKFTSWSWISILFPWRNFLPWPKFPSWTLGAEFLFCSLGEIFSLDQNFPLGLKLPLFYPLPKYPYWTKSSQC